MKEEPNRGLLVKKRGLEEQELDGELLISDPDTGQVHILNETARIIWHLSDGRHTLKEIEQEIRNTFSFSKDSDIEGDIKQSINELIDKKLLI